MKHYMGLGLVVREVTIAVGNDIINSDINPITAYVCYDKDVHNTVVEMPKDKNEIVMTLIKHEIVEAGNDIHFNNMDIKSIECIEDIVDYYIEYPDHTHVALKPDMTLNTFNTTLLCGGIEFNRNVSVVDGKVVYRQFVDIFNEREFEYPIKDIFADLKNNVVVV